MNNDAFTAKRKRNEELRRQLDKVEAELVEEERTNQRLKEEHNRLKAQYQAIKQSSIWKFLSRLKRITRLVVQVLLGKRKLKQLLSPSWKKKNADKHMKKLKYNLYELGFTRKALDDLEAIYQKTDNAYLKRSAAWELALWHANQYSEDGARKCLDYLHEAIRGDDQDSLRRAAILEAESHDLLGHQEDGKQVLAQAMETKTHIDLYLARANLESSMTERLKWINQALALHDMTPVAIDEKVENGTPYDSITSETSEKKRESAKDPKVSVIIPAYNAGGGIRTSVASVLAQTWTNVEVLVVDDCSTDNTPAIVEGYTQRDDRVRLIRAEENQGPYVARNLALQVASGDFVTINDADDWSHPQKIEAQAAHLVANPSVVANTSQQARTTDDLKFYRRGKPGAYMFPNMSSLMFRRTPVMETLGYWDSVRFGADAEFKRRLKQVFGNDAVVDLDTGPLSFPRQSITSLTGNQALGFHGYFMGARKEHFDSYTYYHHNASSLFYDFPPPERPFPVPEPMWPKREDKSAGRRHFHVVIASEFRLLGGTNMSNIEEIKAQKRMRLRTGLIQLSRYDFHSEKETNPGIRELIDGDQVQMLVYGETITCDVLIVRHPPVLQEWQKYIPNVEAQSVNVIINQPPKRDYSSHGETLYDLKRCANHLQDFFGKSGQWYPIGPLVRDTLVDHHSRELKAIKLAGENWVNIIDVAAWQRSSRPFPHDKIRIGRHSRSQYVKWPADREELLNIYPDSEDYEIYVLGGAEAPRNVLGELPANWHVLAFGEEDPKDFLAKLDVFVYYTHPGWVEAFGRVIIEAMAVGVPVIIPPGYKPLFGDAAIYAEPSEVQKKIRQLMNDDHAYAAQVEQAQAYVEKHFGYTKHASRLEEQFLDHQPYVLT